MTNSTQKDIDETNPAGHGGLGEKIHFSRRFEAIMSRSYRKTILSWPAHVRTDQTLKRYSNKSFRLWLKSMRDEDGIPILPRMVSSRASRKWFGGNTYDMRIYQFRVIGGKLVSTSDSPDPYPGYTERKFRHYKCK